MRQTHLKASAYRPVEIAWRMHVSKRWGETRISDVAFTDAQAWVSSFQGPSKGATTASRAFGVLAGIPDDAVRDRRLLTNPARGIALPRKVKQQHINLSHEQVERLVAEAGSNGPMVRLLACCGLRWGEAAWLRIRDCDLLRRRVSIVKNTVEVGSRGIVGTPKNHRQRSVPVPPVLVEHLARQCETRVPTRCCSPRRLATTSRARICFDDARGVRGFFDDDLDAVAERLDQAVTNSAAASQAG